MTSSRNGEASQKRPAAQTPLDETHFIRSKLFARDQSAFARYCGLVFHEFSWFKLIRYELLVTFVGSLPGAVGLALRRRLYPYLFAKTGKGPIFGPGLVLRHADRITLGDNVVLDRGCLLDARGADKAGVTIGNRVIINQGVSIQAKVGRIEIGDDCSIGANVDLVAQGPIILGTNVSIAGKAIVAGGRYVVEKDDDAPETKGRFSGGAIRIGNNSRIGMAAIIQDGVTIGDNAIVASGSVVYEDVAAGTVVWGNPARLLRDRSAQESAPSPENRVSGTTPGKLQSLQRQVCEYLERDLFVEFGPDGMSPADSLLDAGIMDSLALVRLLLWIEQQFDIDLDFAKLDASDIDSVEKIVARIDERQQ